MDNQVPDIVIGRLPIYLRELTRMTREGDKLTTSSHELGAQLGISSAQIRKDLSHFGEFGKQGTGYNINYLIERLTEILHLTDEWSVAVVGAGNLGRALAKYDGFQRRGFCVNAVFDSDPQKVGEDIGGITVRHMDDLERIIRQHDIQIAVLAIPPDVAQAITDRLASAGVRSILSYAPVSLVVPEGVRVSYSDPVVPMQHMAYYLQAAE